MPAENDGWNRTAEDAEIHDDVVKSLSFFFNCRSFVSDFCSSLSSSAGLPTVFVNLQKRRVSIVVLAPRKEKKVHIPATVITAKGEEQV